MKIRLIIAYLLNLFDLLCTSHWISKYGLDIEGNPIGKWLYQNHLAVPVKVFGLGILFVILYAAIKHRDKGLDNTTQWWDIASWLVLIAYALLAIYHVILYFRVASIH